MKSAASLEGAAKTKRKEYQAALLLFPKKKFKSTKKSGRTHSSKQKQITHTHTYTKSINCRFEKKKLLVKLSVPIFHDNSVT